MVKWKFLKIVLQAEKYLVILPFTQQGKVVLFGPFGLFEHRGSFKYFGNHYCY